VTTVEYSLVLAGVAALVVAAFVTFPDAMKHLYEQVFCQLGGSCQANAGGAAPSIDPWDSPDPVVRAKWGNMVVLGDSYSSGEGDDDYGVTGSTSSCHASANAYGPAVADSVGMSDRLRVRACTGATLSNLDGPYRDHNQPPQIGTIDAKTSLITMTLGGNDLGWSGVLLNCIEHNVADVPLDPTCRARHDEEVNQRIRALEPRLEKAYAALHRDAPHARIVVLGYPRFFPAQPTTDLLKAGRSIITTSDEQWMNAKTAEFNRTIAKAAAAQGVEFVDTTSALAGHELTTQDPWIFGVDVDLVAAWPPIKQVQHDIHPTSAGQAAMARLAERQINHP